MAFNPFTDPQTAGTASSWDVAQLLVWQRVSDRRQLKHLKHASNCLASRIVLFFGVITQKNHTDKILLDSVCWTFHIFRCDNQQIKIFVSSIRVQSTVIVLPPLAHRRQSEFPELKKMFMNIAMTTQYCLFTLFPEVPSFFV